MLRIESSRYTVMESGKDYLHSKLFEVHAQMCDISRQISTKEVSYHKQICEGQIEARKKLRDMEKKIKTLDLVLKRKWFEMIACGEKTEEYREIKPYWIKRLIEETDPVHHDYYEKITSTRAEFFSDRAIMLQYYLEEGLVREKGYDTVTFYLGYSKDRPSMTFKIKDIVVSRGKSEWGAAQGEYYFTIKLGERL